MKSIRSKDMPARRIEIFVVGVAEEDQAIISRKIEETIRRQNRKNRLKGKEDRKISYHITCC